MGGNPLCPNSTYRTLVHGFDKVQKRSDGVYIWARPRAKKRGLPASQTHALVNLPNSRTTPSYCTGCGPKYRRARVQPLTRGPEDDETKTMTVARPQHVCMPLSERRQHHPARSTCADAPSLRSSPLGANMVGKSRNMSSDMLFMPGLLALMPPTICCVRSQSVRDLVTEISASRVWDNFK